MTATGTEIAFESLSLALEATRRTAVTPPTTFFNAEGLITNHKTSHRAKESRGGLVEFYRSAIVRKWAEWSAKGDADVNLLPTLFSMLIGPAVMSTPANATLSRLWTSTPNLLADDLKSATLYGGDPNVAVWQAVGAMLDELTLSSNASGTDGVLVDMKGMSKFALPVSAPTYPAQVTGPQLIPQAMQVWVDTTSAIGTTEITTRVVSVEHKLVTGVKYKYEAQGPSGDLGYSQTGRSPRHIETKIAMEMPDRTQYDQWAAHTALKVRVRQNGPLIEHTTVDFFNYAEIDTYGPWDSNGWGALESNRLLELTVLSEMNAGAGWDFAARVQNARTTLL